MNKNLPVPAQRIHETSYRRIRAYVEARLDELKERCSARQDNDPMVDVVRTAELRGAKAELQNMLDAMAPKLYTTEDEAGDILPPNDP